MTGSIGRIRFTWSFDQSRCRATAYDAAENVLAEVVVEVPEATRLHIWRTRGSGALFRIEEIAERHLRAMLELRH